MRVDLEYLRRQYGSLSDEALLAIDRAELVEAARQCYDAEIAARGLAAKPKSVPAPKRPPAELEPYELNGEDGTVETYIPLGEGEEPDWLPDAVEVFSADLRAGAYPASTVADARDALAAARIPCHVESLREAQPASPAYTIERLRVMVPGDLNLRALSILDRDVFNQDFEADWRAHLEQLSDDQLRQMQPQKVLCGLYDRVARVERAYSEELSRRGLLEQSE